MKSTKCQQCFSCDAQLNKEIIYKFKKKIDNIIKSNYK